MSRCSAKSGNDLCDPAEADRLEELLQRAGLPVSVPDGDLDEETVLETMKYAALLQKQHRWDAAAVSAQQTLDMATCDAAAWLGIDGGVKEGTAADVTIIDLDTPGMKPLHDPVSQVVYAAGDGAVSSTIIDGQPVMLEGEFIYADAEEIMSDAQTAAEALTDDA